MNIKILLIGALIGLFLIAVWLRKKWLAMREAEKLLEKVDKAKLKDLSKDGWDDD